MKIIESYLKNNRCYTNNIKINATGLMLHSVGCSQPNATVFISNWNNTQVSKCVHAFIDANTGIVYQCLPWEVKAWHCGSSGNSTHIGIEMCESKYISYRNGVISILDPVKAKEDAKRAYDSAVELFAHLCNKYGIPVTAICSHAEGYKKGIASNHGDPEHYWRAVNCDYTMDAFRASVRAKMGGVYSNTTTVVSSHTGDSSACEGAKRMNTVKNGTKGTHVAMCQGALNYLGKYGLTVDGISGAKTVAAIKDFQKKNNLSADGICGQKTWEKLLTK